MTPRAWLVGVVVAAVLVGCSVTTPPLPLPLTPEQPPVVVEPPATVTPIALRIPSIGLNSSKPWVPLGIQGEEGLPVTTRAGDMETPDVKAPLTIGWYCPNKTGEVAYPYNCGAPEPGRVGSAVVASHINAGGKPGGFSKLAQLKAGALVEVDRADGQTAVFKVAKVQVIDKTNFPASVFDTVSRPVLWMLSCGGRLDKAKGRYLDQVIARADLVEMKPTAP